LESVEGIEAVKKLAQPVCSDPKIEATTAPFPYLNPNKISDLNFDYQSTYNSMSKDKGQTWFQNAKEAEPESKKQEVADE
jgi:hypothetical protein